MERVEFMTSEDSPMKDIIRSEIGGRGHMVVNLLSVVKREGQKSMVNP